MAVTREEKAAAAAGEVCRVPVGLVPGHTRRRPQTPPKQRGRRAPSETPVSAACWRTIRPSQEYYFPHYMRRTDPATGLVTGIVHMAPPSTMPPSVGGCGRRRSLPGTRKACTRPYSLRGAPRHLHPHQPHGARRWRDPLRARNAGQRTPPGTHSPYTGIWPNFAGVRRRPVAPWTQEAGTTPGLHRHRRPRGGDEMSHNEERIRQATDWVKARNAGQRSLAGYTPHRYPANFAGVRRRPWC